MNLSRLTTAACPRPRLTQAAAAGSAGALNPTVPAKLGSRMLAAGVAYEIERATGHLPAPRRPFQALLAGLAAWALVAAVLGGLMAMTTR